MKLQQEDRQVLTNSKHEQAFKIESNSKMFAILSSRIYTYKVAAIVRELSFNAYDSHVEAGKADVPFRVVLPNDLHPFFEIEDFGVGLDEDGVENVYTSYGTSTKTDSNEVVGALGLGSKTPFSYTETFTITARKDGQELLYSAYIGANGAPQVNRLAKRQTSESNGVKITVPVKSKDFRSFYNECSFILSFFRVPPDINDKGFDYDVPKEVVEKIYEGGLVTESVRTSSSLYGDKQIFAVMGGVCYPIQFSDFSDSLNVHVRNYIQLLINDFGYGGNKKRLFLKFEIGELEVSASREALSLDEGSSTVETLCSKFESEINSYFEEERKVIESYDKTIDRLIAFNKRYKHDRNKSSMKGFFKATNGESLKIYDSHVKDIFNAEITPWHFRAFRSNQSYSSGAIELSGAISYKDAAECRSINFICLKEEWKKDVKGHIKHSKALCRKLVGESIYSRHYVIFLDGAVSKKRQERYSRMFGSIEVNWYYLEDLIEEDKAKKAEERKRLNELQKGSGTKEISVGAKPTIQKNEFDACSIKVNLVSTSRFPQIREVASKRYDIDALNKKTAYFWVDRITNASTPDVRINIRGEEVTIGVDYILTVLSSLLNKSVTIFFKNGSNEKKITGHKYIHDLKTTFEKIINRNNKLFTTMLLMTEFRLFHDDIKFQNSFVHMIHTIDCKGQDELLRKVYKRCKSYLATGRPNPRNFNIADNIHLRFINKLTYPIQNKYKKLFDIRQQKFAIAGIDRYPMLQEISFIYLNEQQIDLIKKYIEQVDFYNEHAV